MDKKFLFCVLTGVLCFASNFSFAQGQTAVQVQSFELAGVKIGMTENQAIDTLVSKYNISRSDLEFHTSFVRNPITDKKELDYISVEFDKQEIMVYFQLDITQSPYQLVVSGVYYRLPDTPDNRKNIIDMLTQKYGRPAFRNHWCEPTDYGCKPETTFIETSDTGASISMSTKKYQANITRHQQRQSNRTPNF